MLRGRDVQEIEELKRQGLSIRAISRLTGYDRKTITKYLANPEGAPVYGPRAKPAGKLEAFQPYLQERMQAGVWNARVLLRELRERGYSGGYTLLTDWLRPQRQAAQTNAVRRFETPAGKQAQADWGHLGTLEVDGQERKLWGFTFTLGYSRAMMSQATLDQRLGTLLRMHEEAFRQLGGVPEEILYDFVPGNKIELLWRAALCDGDQQNLRRTCVPDDNWAHNKFALSHHGLPFGISERRLSCSNAISSSRQRSIASVQAGWVRRSNVTSNGWICKATPSGMFINEYRCCIGLQSSPSSTAPQI